MKITCNREQFLTAFKLAAIAAPTRSVKPILQNVKLEVDDSGAVLMATDLEFGVRVSVPGVDVQKAGAAILPTQRFLAIVSEISDDSILLGATDRAITIKSDRSSATLPNENPDEFPDIVGTDEAPDCHLNAATLAELIRRTDGVLGEPHKSYALDGLHFDLTKKTLTLVGTEGHTLATSHSPVDRNGKPPEDRTGLLPLRSVRMLRRLLADLDEDVAICLSGNNIVVQSPSVTAVARQLEGRYPQWRNFIPQYKDAASIPITIGPFASAVRQVSTTCDEQDPKIQFELKPGTMSLSSRSANFGESVVDIPIVYDGKPLSVMLKHGYLKQFLAVMSPEVTCQMEIQDADSAVMFKPSDDHLHLIMPTT